MAMGHEGEVQGDLMMTWAEMRRSRSGTVRNLVCWAIVEPREADYGDQVRYTRPASFWARSEGGIFQGRAFR